jgi:hypothetical protein
LEQPSFGLIAEAEKHMCIFPDGQVGEEQDILLLFNFGISLQGNVYVIAYAIHIYDHKCRVFVSESSFHESDLIPAVLLLVFYRWSF